jgi:hypothetical protein
MSRRPRPDELLNAAGAVFGVLESLADGQAVTHAELVERTGLSGRLVFEAISAIDGTRVLIGGAPTFGYRLARYREDGQRRDQALLSQVREMRRRLQRRRRFAWTLPARPDGAET